MNTLLSDLRYGVRTLRQRPGFAAVAVLTLALAIGATTTIFGVVDAVIIRALPFVEPSRLVQLSETTPQGENFSASEPDFLDFAAQNRSLSGLAAYKPADLTLTGAGDPVQLHGLATSRTLFTLLGVRPFLGRGFLPEEDGAGDASRVTLLSNAFWVARFGGDSSIIGRAVTLNGRPHTVVGVMPPKLSFPAADVYVPLHADANSRRSDHWLRLVGRLRPQVDIADAQTDLDNIARRLGAQYPTNKGWGARVVALSHSLVDDSFRRAGWVLLAATGLLLLLACANVANLLLARATTRQAEMGVRAAIGASRGRLVRQVLTESFVLVALAAALGITGAFWGIAAVHAVGAGRVPRLDEVAMDGRAIGAALALSVLTCLACGLVPALHVSRVDPAAVLGEGARGGVTRQHRRVREALVVFQMALSIVLLVGAGLMVRSFSRLAAVDAGFDADHVLAVNLSLPPQRFSESEQALFFIRLTSRLNAVPGVRAAGATGVDPFSGWSLANDVTPEDRVATTPSSGFMQAGWRSVTPDFFSAMGIPTLRGRVFSSSDAWNGPRIVVVSRSLAAKLWPGRDPIGQRLYWGGTDGKPRTVIGVVGDIRDVAPQTPAGPTLFVPNNQIPMPNMTLVVRAAGDPDALLPAVRDAIHGLDPLLAVADIHRLSRNQTDAMATPRFHLFLMAAFAALALLLASSGVYAVVAFNVAHRRREIGIRLAMGASPAGVVAGFVRSGVLLTMAGVGSGLAVAWFLAGSMRTLLYGIAPTDALTFAVVPVLLAAIALVATYVPARRAADIAPMEALRGD